LEFGLEDVGEVHLRNEVVNFISVGDDDEVVLAFDLTAVDLTGKGCNVQVGSIATRLVKKGLNVQVFLVMTYQVRSCLTIEAMVWFL